MMFIRNGIDLFEKHPNTTLAKLAAKKYWGNFSILNDHQDKSEIIRNGGRYDGAHLYPSGMPKYKHLACLPANIFPMPGTDHYYWDYILQDNGVMKDRPVHEKIILLTENCYLEYRKEIIAQIEALGELL